MKLSRFLAELKRRKVYRAAVVYAVVGVGVLGAAEVILDPLGLGNLRAPIVILVLLGFPIALALAWAYELRPEEPASEPRSPGPQELATATDLPPGLPGPQEPPTATDIPPRPFEPEPSPTATEPSTSPPGSRAEKRPAIAVLPFDDFSPNPADAYFANGIHEEVLTQLQKIRGLAVRGRTSVLRYRNHPKSIREVAQELDVSFVLEGSARKAGDQIRLTAQLIDARKDEHLWAENYDRFLSVENLISVQSDIAQSVAETVGVLISPEERGRIERRPTENLEAYDYYLVGRHHVHRWSLRDLDEGLEYLKKAVEADPDFSQGHAGMAYAYSAMAVFGQSPEETWPNARAAAERALAMDETQAEAHTALALEALSHRYDWQGARAGFLRALEFNPDSVDALDWLAVTSHGIWGRPEEARHYSLRAREVDPHSVTVRYHTGLLQIWSGELEAARATFGQLGDSGSALFMRRHANAYVFMAQERYDEALEAMERAVEVADQRVEIFTGMLGYLYGLVGREEEARAQLRRLDEMEAGGAYVSPVSRAHVHAGLGEKAQALDLLEKAYQERTHWMIWLGNPPWTFKELESEERYRELLKRMAFPRAG